MRKGLIGAAVAAAVVVAGVLPAVPAHADTGSITTVVGGPGSGPALDLGQDPTALALSSTTLWVLDATSSYTEYGYRVRTIDRATGLESEPVFSAPLTGTRVPPSLATTPDGGVVMAYDAASGGSRIIKITRDGSITPLAGGGKVATVTVDGLPGTLAALGEVRGVAVDRKGVVYFTENVVRKVLSDYPTIVSRVRKIGVDGRLLPVAGLDTTGFSGDGGPALAARLKDVTALTLDAAGDLYVADSGNYRIRKVTTSAAAPLISTVVQATTTALAHDGDSLFWVDQEAWSIRRLSPAGVTTVTGDGTLGRGAPDGPAAGRASSPIGLAALGGTLVFSEYGRPQGAYAGHVVNSIDLTTGLLARVAGNGIEQLGGDGGPALKAQVTADSPIAVDAAGRLYIGDLFHLRRVDPDGSVRTVAGTDFAYVPTGLGGPGTSAAFSQVGSVAVAPDGDVYFSLGNRILVLDPASGIVTAVAGGGQQRSDDGVPALQADLFGIRRLAFDSAGNLLFSTYFCKVRRIEPSGVLGTVAGTGSCEVTPDGPITASSGFKEIRDFAVGPTGDLFVLEEQVYNGGLLLRRLSTDGVITTLAGAGSSSADGVPATQASVPGYFTTLAVDLQGRAVLADTYAGRVRRLESDGTITTIVGAGTGPDGGAARTAAVLQPGHLAIGPAGELFLACRDLRTSYHAGVIRKVTF